MREREKDKKVRSPARERNRKNISHGENERKDGQRRKEEGSKYVKERKKGLK